MESPPETEITSESPFVRNLEILVPGSYVSLIRDTGTPIRRYNILQKTRIHRYG